MGLHGANAGPQRMHGYVAPRHYFNNSESDFMSTNTATANLDGRIAYREELEEKIQTLKERISEEQDSLPRKRQKAYEARSKLRRLELEQENLDEGELTELSEARQESMIADNDLSTAEKSISNMTEELNQLDYELHGSYDKTIASEVMSYLKEIKAAAKKVEDIEAAITEQQNLLQQIPSYTSELQDLQRRREDTLAEGAIEEGDLGGLSHLDEKIEALRQAEEKSKEDAEWYNHAIQGLQRKLEPARQEYSAIEAKLPEVMRQFIMSEAEMEARKYLKSAQSTIRSIRRIIALERMFNRYIQGNRKRKFCFNNIDEAQLPSFNLKACDDEGYPNDKTLLFSVRKEWHGAHIEDAYSQELNRIREMGIVDL